MTRVSHDPCWAEGNNKTKLIYSCLILDLEWVSKVRVNTQAVLKRAQQIQGCKVAKKQWQVNCLQYFFGHLITAIALCQLKHIFIDLHCYCRLPGCWRLSHASIWRPWLVTTHLPMSIDSVWRPHSRSVTICWRAWTCMTKVPLSGGFLHIFLTSWSLLLVHLIPHLSSVTQIAVYNTK